LPVPKAENETGLRQTNANTRGQKNKTRFVTYVTGFLRDTSDK